MTNNSRFLNSIFSSFDTFASAMVARARFRRQHHAIAARECRGEFGRPTTHRQARSRRAAHRVTMRVRTSRKTTSKHNDSAQLSARTCVTLRNVFRFKHPQCPNQGQYHAEAIFFS